MKEAASGSTPLINTVEGWHHGVTALLMSSQRSLHTFLHQLQLEASIQKFNIPKAVGGNIIKLIIKKNDEKDHKNCKQFR